MWSFVRSKHNRQWMWLAVDEPSAEMVGVCVGARDRGGAEGLWTSQPAVYRQCAVASTDFWSSYEESLPASRHRAVGKETGGTSKIERFNHTMRQPISRLVRKTLSCSKKLLNHIGAIWLFVHHDNASLGQ
jgi:insertion element IS1 protein InsB